MPVTVPSVGSKITGATYNNIQDLSEQILGNGSTNFGYGQTYIQASNVATGKIIEPAEWVTLSYDLLNIADHQQGSTRSLSVVATSLTKILDDDASTFSNYINSLESNRFVVHSSRRAQLTSVSTSRTSSWSREVSNTITLTFASSDEARYFFNQGGKVLITSSRTGGSSTSQNTSWSSLLTANSPYSFDHNQFFQLTTTNQNFLNAAPSSPYASNRYIIRARRDSTSRIISIDVVFDDNYTDPSPGNPPAPEDIVNGTLTSSYVIEYPTIVSSVMVPGLTTWRGFSASGLGGYTLPTHAWANTSITGS
jgi:hypothetical protein